MCVFPVCRPYCGYRCRDSHSSLEQLHAVKTTFAHDREHSSGSDGGGGVGGGMADNGKGEERSGRQEKQRGGSVARTSDSILNRRRLTVQTQRLHYAHIPCEG